MRKFIEIGLLSVVALFFAYLASSFRIQSITASFETQEDTSVSGRKIKLPSLAIRNVYDGDTFNLSCYEGMKCKTNSRGKEYMPVRGEGFDTPERSNPECDFERKMATLARQHVVSLWKNSSEILVVERGQDRYGRLLAKVYFDGVDWGGSLISAGLARKWTGRQESWCTPDAIKEFSLKP